MSLFKDVETLNIVYRQHEFNAEALDGIITRIEDTAKCTALKHTPNASWSYDILPVFTGYADITWDKFNANVSEKPSTPEPFTCIILADDIDEYARINNYNLLQVISNKKVGVAKFNFTPPKRSTFVKSIPETVESIIEDYSLKLVRDGEPTTYKFKPPNLR